MVLTVKKGYLALYYCYDIGDGILLNQIQSVKGAAPEKTPLQYTKLTPPYLQYREPPLYFHFGSRLFQGMKLECSVKLYDFGVVTIRLSVPLLNIPAEQLVGLSKKCVENNTFEQFARTYLDQVKEEIKDFLIPHHASLTEDPLENYAVFFVHAFNTPVKGEEFLKKHKSLMGKILKSDEHALSSFEEDDTVKYFISYYKNDITIIDWNAAFLYDPQQGYDVLDVLEYAVIELLELRAYDTLLDRVLDKAYDDLSHKRVKTAVLHTLSQVRLDVADVVEKVENSLKLIGDLYLAKVYSTAASRFYLDKWKKSVREKLDTIESMYQVLYDRKQNARMMLLEILIVVLFVIDLVFIFIDIFLKYLR